VLLDAAGRPIAPSYAFDPNVENYLGFLRSGLEKFRAVR
jgi:hypothetical protein